MKITFILINLLILVSLFFASTMCAFAEWWGGSSGSQGFLNAGGGYPVMPNFSTTKVSPKVHFMRGVRFSDAGFQDEKGNFINPTGIGETITVPGPNPTGTFLVTMISAREGLAFNPAGGIPEFVSQDDKTLMNLKLYIDRVMVHYDINVVRDNQGVIMSNAIPASVVLSKSGWGEVITNIIYRGKGLDGPSFEVLEPGKIIKVEFH